MVTAGVEGPASRSERAGAEAVWKDRLHDQNERALKLSREVARSKLNLRRLEAVAKNLAQTAETRKAAERKVQSRSGLNQEEAACTALLKVHYTEIDSFTT
eukprot:835918-Prorocentrum_minimum.AAC.4